MENITIASQEQPVRVLDSTATMGRLVAQRLAHLDIASRIDSAGTEPPFDWQQPDTWSATLDGISTAFIHYQPAHAAASAPDPLAAFIRRAAEAGLQRLVLMAGRGESLAGEWEHAVRASGADWTILRAGWLQQNFCQHFYASQIAQGELALPAADVREPFLDARDAADVAVAALSESWHSGKTYELTGPRLMSFADIAREISNASGKRIAYKPLSLAGFRRRLARAGSPEAGTWLLERQFTELLDGRNESVEDGVYRALCRVPRDFTDFAAHAVRTGAWNTGTPAGAPPRVTRAAAEHQYHAY